MLHSDEEVLQPRYGMTVCNAVAKKPTSLSVPMLKITAVTMVKMKELSVKVSDVVASGVRCAFGRKQHGKGRAVYSVHCPLSYLEENRC